MIVTDTNSKGKIVFKSKGGSHIALLPEELDEALREIQQVLLHLDQGLPRKKLDSRKY